MVEKKKCQKCYLLAIEMNKYTEEQKEFLINNNYMKTARELCDMFNKKFGDMMTPEKVKKF